MERSGRETGTRQARLAWLTDELSRRPAEEIVDYGAWWKTAQGRGCTVDLYAAYCFVFGRGSLDGFEYFVNWLISLGRDPGPGRRRPVARARRVQAAVVVVRTVQGREPPPVMETRNRPCQAVTTITRAVMASRGTVRCHRTADRGASGRRVTSSRMPIQAAWSSANTPTRPNSVNHVPSPDRRIAPSIQPPPGAVVSITGSVA
ncbi:DUF4240 domain-containing protein [Streptosporangium algeriense]|uniref:DUF4240 domain-containing protein n=1 Tax=Streptosporangium algeriense TaxID=1682748 RepID=A0ABW3DP54_9ACTN